MTIDVIVPIYRDAGLTRRCIESVLAARQVVPFELILIDDASPEAEIQAYLDQMSDVPGVTVLRQPANLGFVATANAGMARHADRDVVLLNSDTEVSGDWLDRLRQAAYREAKIGTATPFSNNATICSYPVFCADNALPEGLGAGELDALFRIVNAEQWAELPTAVGFCMYIRRACLDQVGLFDVEHFGRGYGEENDFCLRAAQRGWRHVLAADVFVFHAGSASFGADKAGHLASGSAAMRDLHPEYEGLVRRFLALDPLRPLRHAVDLERMRRTLAGLPTEAGALRSGQASPSRTHLHVVHGLGGGAENWLRDYCASAGDARNLILRPLSWGGDQGLGLALYDSVDLERPLRVWQFARPIPVTQGTHGEHDAVFAWVLEAYRVDALLVSSLIGHSLAVLRTGLPTLYIAHDYFPYCPAITLYFDGVCRHCDADRLAECHARNGRFNHFPSFGLAERRQVRDLFVASLTAPNVLLVTPSASVQHHLRQLDGRFEQVRFFEAPHGYRADLVPLAAPARDGHARLRVLVLGQLAPHKGVDLLLQALESIIRIADLYLLGCRELGDLFLGREGVHVIPEYARADLADQVACIQPDLGLVASIWPETYGYTLTELMVLGIPPLATELGAFAERIRHDETGFLYAPNADALLAELTRIDRDRGLLAHVREILRAWRPRALEAMAADYRTLSRALPTMQIQPIPTGADLEGVAAFDAADPRWPLIRQLLDLHKAERSLAVRRHFSAERLTQIDRDVSGLRADLSQRDAALQARESQLAEVYASSSWRLSAPLRLLGNGLRKSRIAWRCLAPLADRPGAIPAALRVLWQAARDGGLTKLKAALLSLPAALGDAPAADDRAQDWQQSTYRDYRTTLTDAIRTEMANRIRALPAPPLISVLVPVYDTAPTMLEAMLDSVRSQIYPHWQLCIVDDGSTQPHVRKILTRHARRDPRIRVQLEARNQGVSHASNRALAMAEGEYIVLLDHDDMLEPQALYRVAEAVLADQPDMLYSDELLVGADGETVQHYIFRPAFSPEYLRAHPYIVHLVGFRTELLRRLGGFDEALHISQDYDLILRASEQARTIVHIPEMLYRWRIHGGSAGHARIHEVMATSKRILQRHLERSGEAGEVNDGASFNYFETRYPLQAGLKVAIVIPTKNQADLVRACIESIERTVRSVAFDIVLVDHASDAPDALACFAELGARVRLLRYGGPFNFSAINNWAVAQLDGSHSHYLFCNNDVEALQPGWLERMLELGQKPDVGIVGAKLYYPDRKTVQHAGVVVACCGVAENLGRFRETTADPLDLGYVGSLIANHELSAVTGACLLIRRAVFDEIGGFDERLWVGYGDVDLCLRARRSGYRVVFCPHAELLHYESYTRGRHPEDPHPEDSTLFRAKWRRYYVEGDPYFNPNLSRHSPNWQVARPLEFSLDIRRRVWNAR